MDVDEILSFKPQKPDGKRKVEESNRDELIAKRQRAGNAGNTEISDHDRLTQMMNDIPEAEPLHGMSLKKMLLMFEKRVYRNQEMRIKFPDAPERFMDSEVELNDTLQQMHVIATVPALYRVLVDLNTVRSLLQLLSHENTDIAIAVVDLLQELTDVDMLNESEEDAGGLVEALLAGQVTSLLVQNIERLDENVKEESDGIHNTLAIIENITEFRPEVCGEVAQQGTLVWLMKRLKSRTQFDVNKLYASEVMAILLQNSDDVRQLLGELDGIDVLLQQMATYKRHNPASKEEIEYMENVFNCLCSAVMFSTNRGRFLRGEGLQLMNLMLREKKLSRNCAIKVLNHSMTGMDGLDNSQKFIEILGLRTIFPLLMKTPKTAKAGPPSDELEEHICSIIGSLLHNSHGTQRQRLLGKFMENDHEKVERLMELHFKHLDKVRQCDDDIEREKLQLKRQGLDVDDDTEDEFYLKRLDSGLFTLQLIDYIMLEICASGSSSIKSRVMQILNMRGGSIKVIRGIMREYAGNIGDANNPAAREMEQSRILQLVDKF